MEVGSRSAEGVPDEEIIQRTQVEPCQLDIHPRWFGVFFGTISKQFDENIGL